MIKIQAKTIKMVPLDEIKLNPKNRNKHPDKQIDRLVEILKYQGFRRPGTISNRTGYLVCGEGRYLAAKKAGMKAMPVIYQDYDSEEQEFADSIADNALDKWAELDIEGIREDVKALDDEFNLDMMGIKGFKMEKSDVSEVTLAEEFNILVQCDSEKDQEKLFSEFEKRGLKVTLL